MKPFTLVFDVSIQCHYEAPGSYQGLFKCSEWLFPNLFGWTIPWENASVSHNMLITYNTPNMISKGHLIFWPRPHVPYFSEFCLGVSLICPLNLVYQVGHPINFKMQMTPNNDITNQLVITHYNKAACVPYLRYFFLVLSWCCLESSCHSNFCPLFSGAA